MLYQSVSPRDSLPSVNPYVCHPFTSSQPSSLSVGRSLCLSVTACVSGSVGRVTVVRRSASHATTGQLHLSALSPLH